MQREQRHSEVAERTWLGLGSGLGLGLGLGLWVRVRVTGEVAEG